jgi:hypothetical protein
VRVKIPFNKGWGWQGAQRRRALHNEEEYLTIRKVR